MLSRWYLIDLLLMVGCLVSRGAMQICVPSLLPLHADTDQAFRVSHLITYLYSLGTLTLFACVSLHLRRQALLNKLEGLNFEDCV